MFFSLRLIHHYLPCSAPYLLTRGLIFVNGYYRRYIFASSRCLDSDCQLMALLWVGSLHTAWRSKNVRFVRCEHTSGSEHACSSATCLPNMNTIFLPQSMIYSVAVRRQQKYPYTSVISVWFSVLVPY